MSDDKLTSSDQSIRQVLEDLTDRACKDGVIRPKMPETLSEFVDWLRGLYPELYSTISDRDGLVSQPSRKDDRDNR